MIQSYDCIINIPIRRLIVKRPYPHPLMPKDYYHILGISKDASPEEVKKAFRRLAHEFHPDKPGGGNEAKFKEINEAYQTLSDPQKRARYDQFGSAEFEGTGMGFEDFFRHGGAQGFGAQFDLGDLFGDFFGGGGGARQERRGRNIEVDVTLDFVQAAHGATRTISLRKLVKCDECHGKGIASGSKMKKCAHCGGKGQTVEAMRTLFGTFQTARTCEHCRGRGEVPEKKCASCHGDGRITRTVELEVTIPPGIDNGEVVRLTGQGEAGAEGARAGDLYLRVAVRPDPRFIREGNDLVIRARIPFTTAILGGEVTIPTLEGEGDLKISAGTQPNAIIRLKDKGLASPQTGYRGDALIHIEVEIPKHLSKRQKKILEEFLKE